jgi:hypothetical protein
VIDASEEGFMNSHLANPALTGVIVALIVAITGLIAELRRGLKRRI